MHIAIATVRPLPESDPDEAPLCAALTAAGARVTMLDWHDESADLGAFDTIVVRSTWDSHHHPAAFAEWVGRAGSATVLRNPPEVLRWSLHKRYLRDLEQRGIPIVPTAWIGRGETAAGATVRDAVGTADVVVKPAISASSWRTTRVEASATHAELETAIAELSAERDVMVQSFMASTETVGERAIVWIDGEVTHAIRKTPRFADGAEAVSESLPPSDDERAFAASVLDAARASVGPAAWRGVCYARVDIMHDAGGAPLLSELELLEPSLYLVEHPPALDRLVQSLLAS